MPSQSFPIVDTHAHVYRKDLPMADDRRYTPETDATPTQYADMRRALRASRAVLIQPSFLGTDNHYMLALASRHPETMRAVVAVDPNVNTATLRVHAAQGAVGIRLNLLGQALPDLAATRWDRLLAFVQTHDWHVELHCEAARLAEVVPPLLTRGCRVVIDHFGRPDPALGERDPGFRYLLQTAASRRVWIKVSAPYRVTVAPDGGKRAGTLLDAALEAFSADFLLWGSDWPHSQHPDAPAATAALHALCSHVRKEEDLRRILWHTPNALFHF